MNYFSVIAKDGVLHLQVEDEHGTLHTIAQVQESSSDSPTNADALVELLGHLIAELSDMYVEANAYGVHSDAEEWYSHFPGSDYLWDIFVERHPRINYKSSRDDIRECVERDQKGSPGIFAWRVEDAVDGLMKFYKEREENWQEALRRASHLKTSPPQTLTQALHGLDSLTQALHGLYWD